jgi:hypothetical protein
MSEFCKESVECSPNFTAIEQYWRVLAGIKLNNTVLECVHRYKYLGLTFFSSGSFMYAQEELYNKASKAYFKVSKDPLSLNPGLHTNMHVFDHTSGAKVQLFAYNKFGQKINSASHV